MNDVAKELAETHWNWVETWLRMVYIDAFIHGFKHGEDEVLNAGEKSEPPVDDQSGHIWRVIP